MDDDPNRNDQGQTDKSKRAAELFPEEPQVSLDDANYADIVLDRAIREAKEAASTEQSKPPRSDFSRSTARRQGSISRNYSRFIREELNYLPTWPPTLRLRPGDIGVISGGTFMRLSTITAMEPTSQVLTTSSTAQDNLTISGPGPIRFYFIEGSDKHVDDPAYKSSVSSQVGVQMGGEGTVLVVLKAVTVDSILNMDTIARSVVDLADKGEWSRDWLLITHVMQANNGLILICQADEAVAQFRIPPESQVVGLDPLSALSLSALNESRIDVSGTSGSAMNIVGQGLTPCFRAVRLRRGFLRGDSKLVPVNDI